jgi:osmotically-inducible protein OsmY
MQKISSIAAAVIAATMLSACADIKVTPNPIVPDTRIAAPVVVNPDVELAEAVRAQLRTMGVRGVTATVAKGEVTLKGEVETGQDLARVARAIQGIKGVTAVFPDVNVKR